MYLQMCNKNEKNKQRELEQSRGIKVCRGHGNKQQRQYQGATEAMETGFLCVLKKTHR